MSLRIRSNARGAPPPWRAVPWLALLVAFSPVLADLARTWQSQPKHRPALLVPFLLLWAWRVRARAAPRPAPSGRRDGAVVVGAGTGLLLIGIAGDAWSLARLGLPVAAGGLARLLGSPPLVVVALAVWLVPVPDSLLLLTSPNLETAWAHATAWVLGPAGVGAVGPSLRVGATRLDLLPGDGGVLLAHLLAALGWFRAVLAGATLTGALRRSALAALLGLAIQPLGIFAAGALLRAGHAELARSWLTTGLWMIAAGAFLAADGRIANRRWPPMQPTPDPGKRHGTGAPIPEG